MRSLERRRRLLVGLIAAVMVSLAWALLLSGSWMLHGVIDLVLGFYVVGLLEAKRRRAERASKVRGIGTPARGGDEEVRFYEPVRASGGRR